MNLRFGLRESDVLRREDGIISWLGFRPHMTGKELSGLFSEGISGSYVDPAKVLTQLAVDELVKRGLVRETVTTTPGGLSFCAFNLIDPSAVNRINPETVELAPRELVLLRFMDIRRGEAHTATRLEERLDLHRAPDSWRTQACLSHLASLGLVHAAENLSDGYILPPYNQA